MQRILLIAIISILSIFLVYLLIDRSVTTTMKYFPFDEVVTFDRAMTNITPSKDEDTLEWSVESTSSEEVYLRQDVSLLYENGKFKGVLNKWREQIADLELVKSFSQTNSGLLQAISFHHGEIHYPDDSIKSIQQMTTDALYFVRDEDTTFSFHTPDNLNEKRWEKELNKTTKQQLLIYWHNLINSLQINQDDYLLIPLTELITYEDTPLPGHTESETKQIIGQLWEGLYKNYIVLLANDGINETAHYIPLIMVAKDISHLLVVFELNNEKQKLIQRLP